MFQELAINGKEREISLENKAKDILLFQLPKAPLQKGDPSKLQIKKTTFQAPKSCFFIFPSRHSWEQALSFSGAFSTSQSATAKGDPSKLQIKKTTFQAPKSCFFIFPSRHSWEQALSFSGAFSTSQSATAKGDPSKVQIRKQFFGLRKVVFFKSGFERPKCFILATCPLDLVQKVDISVFKAKRVTHRLQKKTTFRSPKSCFFQKWF